ncbi:hypothetical protein K2173_021903 [Erythroxylum novogranatense]|uniref:WRKY domain-containing protein n=1 Tax=Erythroxylum novogranatense TaxID=1862640 RepID=A0AAV8T3M7_9ROSI|nr:hypothetical protein K2173_021903 [Erythroxylum novogranatense]
METASGKSVHGSVAFDNEKKMSLDGGEEAVLVELNKDNLLGRAKAKITEAREQNLRLKQLLSQLEKDYQSLQKHFYEIFEQEQESKTLSRKTETASEDSDQQELLCLCLGRSSSEPNNIRKKSNILVNGVGDDMKTNGSSLSLGVDCKIETASKPTTKNPSSEDIVEDNKGAKLTPEILPPSKILKTKEVQGDEVSRDTQTKKPRVSVKARVQTPMMNDGCQWRKYGQKIAKGNPCPRAYYRCTVSPTCPVRKQVQRCSEDLTILITTYEGTHNHPLSLSATAMASTTSAAVSMLQSCPSTSSRQGQVTSVFSPSPIGGLLNFSHFQDTSQHQFYLPNSSMSTSASTSHPAVTLDFTAPTINTIHFDNCSNTTPPGHFSTYLNFSSPYSPSLEHN